MVKDHSDSERGKPLPPHGLLFAISSKWFFYMYHPTDRITNTTAFATPEREVGKISSIFKSHVLVVKYYILLLILREANSISVRSHLLVVKYYILLLILREANSISVRSHLLVVKYYILLLTLREANSISVRSRPVTSLASS